MSTSENARSERRRALEAAPWWVRSFKAPLNAARLAEKFVSGAYRQKRPFEYAAYASVADTERTVFSVSSTSFRWKAS